MTMPRPVRIDEKGRVTIPREVREELGLHPGATLFLRQEGQVLHFAVAQDPFEGLADYAVAQREEGLTRSLRDYARDRNIDLRL